MAKVPLQKIQHADPDTNRIQKHVEDAINKIGVQTLDDWPDGKLFRRVLGVDATNLLTAAAFAAGVVCSVPIGGMVWVDITLTGCPTPGANFQKMDGTAITDTRSPMVGQNTRDLITAGRFVRAGATSGVTQTADAVVPAHAHDLNSHTHTSAAHVHGPASMVAASHSHNISNSAAGGTFAAISASNPGSGGTNFTTQLSGTLAVTGNTASTTPGATGAAVGNTGTDGGSGAETRPINISMVPYMRIW